MTQNIYFDDSWKSDLTNKLVIDLPLIESEQDFFDFFDKALSFPDYFGFNWDAFHECIGDLTWLKTNHIVIVHESMPFNGNTTESQKYLKVMNSANSILRERHGGSLTLVFPKRSENQINDLMENRN